MAHEPRMSDTLQPRGSDVRTPKASLLAHVEVGAAKPTVGAGADKSKANSEYRGRRIREGAILLAQRKAWEKRWLVLWENKELIIYLSKPYNDRSTFKALVKLTPAGCFFFLTSKDHPTCFEVQHQGQVFRFACSTEDREKWATVLLRGGLRLILGPGQGESDNVKNLVNTLPKLQRLEQKETALQVLCVECDLLAADVTCEQCEDAYCNKCFEIQHRSGKRATHTTQVLGRDSSSRPNIDIAELYAQPFPFSFADLLENIPTVAEVDAFVPPKSPSTPLAGSASEKEWSHQSEFVDSISSEELLRKAVTRSAARPGVGSKGGLLRKLEDSDDDEEGKDNPEALKAAVEAQTQLIAQFRSCCEIKDRSYLLRSYPKCFVGKDTVDMLVKKEVVFTRSEAVRVGNKLVEDGVISHVTNEHGFEDANLYYRFNADQVQVVRA